jgi:flagellar basal-body rod protein FlgF
MNVSLYQAAAGMKATTRWQEVIAENLSSGPVPGFKRQRMSFGAVEAGLMTSSPGVVQGGNRHFSLAAGQVGFDFEPGELKPSPGPADVAINGKGFFEVELPNGRRAYTRDGEFHVGSTGQLVTKQGFIVQGANGPIQLDANNAPLSISAQGNISQGANPRGSLKVVDFPDYGQLQGVGGGYFVTDDPTLLATPVAKPAVQHGFLESSNLSNVREMADLLSSVRHFEANQKVIQTQDERLGRLISELGTPG